jgi:hypothetical protein
VQWRTRDGSQVQELQLGALKRQVLDFVPGQKICYVTDAADNERNRNSLAGFLKGAELRRSGRGEMKELGRQGRRIFPLSLRAAGIEQAFGVAETRDVIGKSILFLRPHAAKRTGHLGRCEVLMQGRSGLDLPFQIGITLPGEAGHPVARLTLPAGPMTSGTDVRVQLLP